MPDITAKSVLVSVDGGSVDFLSPSGEFLFSVPVPPGRHSARPYLALRPAGASVEFSGDLVAVAPRSGYGVQPYGAGSHSSGANPDYRPTSATRFEREMRQSLARMQAATSRVEARERALRAVEHIPRAPDPAAVVKPAPAPASAEDAEVPVVE